MAVGAAASAAAGERRLQGRLLRQSTAARRALARAGLLAIASALAIVAQAALLAHLIAAAVAGAALGSLRSELLALAGATVARALLAGAFESSGRLGAAAAMSELRGRLALRLLVEAPGRATEESEGGGSSGELAGAAVVGVDALSPFFAGYLPALSLALAVPLVGLAYLVQVDPIAAALLALCIPLLVVFMILIGKRAGGAARSRMRALGILSGHFVDVVSGLSTLRVFRREHAQVQTIARVGERLRTETLGTLRVAFLSALVLELGAMIAMALVAATIGVQLDGGALGLQAGLVVLLLAPEIYGALRGVGQRYHAGADGLAAAQRIFALLDEEVGLQPARSRRPAEAAGQRGRARVEDAGASPHAPAAIDPRRAAVCLEDVHLSFAQRARPVLRGVDLCLPPGSATLISGASGSGKSTLALLLLGLLEPSAGRVRCGGHDIAAIGRERWWGQVAWMPQRPRIYAGTVAQNIALYDRRMEAARIEEAARAAGLGELLAQLPDGLQTRIGEGARALSCGQAGRIALARVLAARAALVVLDEPFAHLDERSREAIAARLATLQGTCTLLVIGHHPEAGAPGGSLAEAGRWLRGARVLELHDGCLAAAAGGASPGCDERADIEERSGAEDRPHAEALTL